MRINQVRMLNFRNHADSVIDFSSPGLTVITGPNGAGKTSVLEAVHVLATGRSFRTTRETAMIRESSATSLPRAFLDCWAERSGRKIRIGMGLGEVSPKFLLNGAKRTHAREITGLLRCVIFSPDDLDLIKGGPSLRRDYLDTILVAVVPRLSALVQEWERVLKQRNALLRTAPAGARRVNLSALATWTDLLVEKGALLTAERMNLCEKLRPFFVEAVDALSGQSADLHYNPSWAPLDVDPQADILRGFLVKALEREQRAEFDRRLTLVGPHRDALDVSLQGRDARSCASQGEQRTLALGLRLGNLGLLEQACDEDPILLLDDVFSELDTSRRARLLSFLPKTQTLVTMTDDPNIAAPSSEFFTAFADAGLCKENVNDFKKGWGTVRIEGGKVIL